MKSSHSVVLVLSLALLSAALLSHQPAQSAPPARSSMLVRLGEKIFFDARFSANGKVSCATCHQPERAFTDGRQTAVGVTGQPTTRNSPSLLNVSEVRALFWDGRSATLEEQALEPFTTAVELGLNSIDEALQRLRNLPEYAPLIHKALGASAQSVSATDIGRALAAYQRSLQAGSTPFDRYYFEGQTQALSSAARRGLVLFTGQAGCSSCHPIEKDQAPFTDHQFHALGFRGDPHELAAAIARLAQTPDHAVGQQVLSDPAVATLGRFVATRRLDDIGKFRTPTLRNVALTAPYMHDGAMPTLEAAIEHELYYRGQADGSPRVLTPDEQADLAAFLRSLTSDR